MDDWVDTICKTLDQTPALFEQHGTAIMFTVGPIFVLVGYFGAHWINSRQFYRNKAGGHPFNTYFQAWRVKMFEAWGGFFSVALMLLGFVCILAGAVDWVDG